MDKYPNTIILKWHYQDVMNAGVNLGYTVRGIEAREILHKVEEYYNTDLGNLGITWDTLKKAIEKYMKNKMGGKINEKSNEKSNEKIEKKYARMG